MNSRLFSAINSPRKTALKNRRNFLLHLFIIHIYIHVMLVLTGTLCFRVDGEVYNNVYVKPWCRMGSFAIGLILGYWLLENECKIKFLKVKQMKTTSLLIITFERVVVVVVMVLVNVLVVIIMVAMKVVFAVVLAVVVITAVLEVVWQKTASNFGAI